LNVNVPHDYSGIVSSEICSLDSLTREADSVLLSGKAEAGILGRNMSGGATNTQMLCYRVSPLVSNVIVIFLFVGKSDKCCWCRLWLCRP